MTPEETAARIGNAAAVVKLICGVANNAAWLTILDAHDHARRCPNYRQGVKRKFKMAIQALRDYERDLLHSEENRMFHLADMSERVRKKYGDITDREFYDFWAGTGAAAYDKTRPLLTSLQNKYKLSLEREHIPEAYNVAWVMVGMAAVELAVRMYEKAIDECEAGYKLPRRLLERVFGQFSLARVAKLWREALIALCPGCEDVKPSKIDARNIEMGLEDLTKAWIDPTMLYNSAMDTVEEYKEVFRTKGEQKKSLREIAEVKAETMKELATS
jgi:hypothetical protein